MLSPTKFNNFYSRSQSNLFLDFSEQYNENCREFHSDVYQYSSFLAESLKILRVVDIGGSQADQLPQYFSEYKSAMENAGNPSNEIQKPNFYYVDYKDQRNSDVLDFAQFMSVNLEDCDEIFKFRSSFDDDIPTIFILSGVLERLFDPRFLLAAIRYLLKKNKSSRLIISTPDRFKHKCKKTNATRQKAKHVRLWAMKELQTFLEESAFKIEELRYTKRYRTRKDNSLVLACVSCDVAFYNHWLADRRLPCQADHLVITTEHDTLKFSGRIGAFVGYTADVLPSNRIILFVGNIGLDDQWQKTITEKRWIHLNQITEKSDFFNYNREDILEAVFTILFIYETIRIIEYPDYEGVGHRIAQAKVGCLLPQYINVVAVVHGNHYYLDQTAEIVSHREIEVDVMEKISIENADHVVFPTKYLKTLYERQQGMQFKNAVLSFPMSSENYDENANYGPLNTLIYFGKKTNQKGLDKFCDALIELKTKYKVSFNAIESIIFLGVSSLEPEILNLKKTIKYGIFSAEKEKEIIKSLRNNALVILPYQAHDYPIWVLDVIRAGAQFIVQDSEAVRDVIDPSLVDDVLYDNDLTFKINKKFSYSHSDRARITKNVKQKVEASYLKNYIDLDTFLNKTRKDRALVQPTRSKVSLVITNYKGTETYLDELHQGVLNSRRLPDEIIIVDDCSPEPYRSILERFFSRLSSLIESKLIFNEVNVGLAAARNVGLQNTNYDYVLIHDNDNIMMNNNIYQMAKVLDLNRDVDCVTSFCTPFNDGENWRVGSKNHEYRPLGQDFAFGVVHGSKNNCFGDAHAMFRRSTLLDIGGYDASTRAMWEDLQLYLKLTLANKKIAIVPQNLFFYRVRKNSMLRTYAIPPAFQRVERTLIDAGIPSAELLLREVIHNNVSDDSAIEKMYAKILVSRSKTFMHLFKIIFNKKAIKRRFI